MNENEISPQEQLLQNIKAKLPELEKLLADATDHWAEIDCIYRFYHQSFKVYYIQNYTIKITEALKALSPEGATLNNDFKIIYEQGTGKTFKMEYNKDWHKHTLPLTTAYFHAKYFLEMAIKCAKEMEHDEQCMPSGYASLLYFYNLR
jgi:hypothetical protein